MVNKERMPLLVYSESCKKIGEKLTLTFGTPGYMDPEDEFKTSEAHHDFYNIARVREWMDKPVIDR